MAKKNEKSIERCNSTEIHKSHTRWKLENGGYTGKKVFCPGVPKPKERPELQCMTKAPHEGHGWIEGEFTEAEKREVWCVGVKEPELIRVRPCGFNHKHDEHNYHDKSKYSRREIHCRGIKGDSMATNDKVPNHIHIWQKDETSNKPVLKRESGEPVFGLSLSELGEAPEGMSVWNGSLPCSCGMSVWVDYGWLRWTRYPAASAEERILALKMKMERVGKDNMSAADSYEASSIIRGISFTISEAADFVEHLVSTVKESAESLYSLLSEAEKGRAGSIFEATSAYAKAVSETPKAGVAATAESFLAESRENLHAHNAHIEVFGGPPGVPRALWTAPTDLYGSGPLA